MIIFQKTLQTDEDGRVPHRESFNSSKIMIQFQFDFTERQFTINYFGVVDVISTLGGINGFITPILAGITPLFMLVFLIEFAKYIGDMYDKDYKNELIKILID